MEHTSKSIIGTKSDTLKGKKIVLAITGSVACTKSPDIARELMRHGAEVYPVMSKSAQTLIGPTLLEWATGNRCITGLTGQAEHVTLCGAHDNRADLLLIAPSTSNTISKIANGIDDTTVTTMAATAIGTKMPVIIVPAMHISMYENPFVKKNIETLKNNGMTILDPEMRGTKARLRTTDEIISAVISAFTKKDLKGKKIVVTGGPTIENIDQIRIITNRGSGKTGKLIAENAHMRGADVTFIAGYGVDTSNKQDYITISTSTTSDMLKAVEETIKGADIFIHTASVSDFAPKPDKGKISSDKESLTLTLTATPKILDQVKKINKNIYLVGFKAEHGISRESLIEKAKARLEKSGADMIIANDVKERGMGTDDNQVTIVTKKSTKDIPTMPKKDLAKIILDGIVSELP